MFTTTTWTGDRYLHYMLAFGLAFGWPACVILFGHSIEARIDGISFDQHHAIIWGVIIVGILCVIPIYSFLLPYRHTLSALLYMWIVLRTPVSWRDARLVEMLFVTDGRGGGVWYPMLHIRFLPPHERRDTLLAEGVYLMSKPRWNTGGEQGSG